METLLTVEAAATRLGLHQKTVLRLIREGRLRATRIGKSYRIQRSDFDAFSGQTHPLAPSQAAGRATCVVDIPAVSPELAQRLSSFLSASLAGRATREDPAHLSTAYDPGARQLKIVIIGALLDTAALLTSLNAYIEAAG